MDLQLQLDFVDWVLIAAALLGLYSILLLPLRDSERWRQRGVTVWGPVPLAVFLRTTRGLKLLDRLSRPRRFWRIVASAGVPLVVLSMAYFLILVLLMAYLMIQEPPQPSNYNAPRNILLIPGLNEYIPFVWGWIALFVTMVVHEFAHGILSRVEGVRVKSMGIVTILVAPIAAFVEPDEEELFGTKEKPPAVSKGARIRILSAGVISNFIVAAVAMALFFGPVIGSITPVDRLIVVDVQDGSAAQMAGIEEGMALVAANGREVGSLAEFYGNIASGTMQINVIYNDLEESLKIFGEPERGIMVASIFEGSPAFAAGLPARSVVTKIDGVEIGNLEGFRNKMNTTHPGQTITITTGDGKTYLVKLTQNSRVDSVSSNSNAGFIGIGISGNAVYLGGAVFQEAPSKQFLQVLKAIPYSGLQGFTYMLSLPFTGIPGFTQKGFPGFSGWLTTIFEPSGWAEPLGGKFFWIANLLLWVGWINLYAGLFNCLPAVPLDGGHIFRDLVQASFELIVKPSDAEKLTRTIVALLAWMVLTSLLITLVAPFTHWLSL
ncbi:MAG: zinc metallopeptidase RseP [Methanosaeta sp. PtaB.Bin018]|nr:MAG: zinc metallopeptidase RseP [Methanosaeta sp. PtaB.Bin018]OPY47828.1 MAG: zinc metallopeptidase RseP [Methanosaeta sp. PtaU1.Bin016]